MRKIITLFTFLCFTSIILAQETVYFKSDKSKTSRSKKKGSSELNIIKIAPFAFIGGNIPVFFERSINETFSIQAGIGVTSKNYILDALRAASNDGGSSGSVYGAQKIVWNNGQVNDISNQIDDLDNNYLSRKSKLGFSYSIEPKVYLESEGLDGAFLSLSYNSAKFSNSINTIKKGLPYSSTPALDGGTFIENYKINNLLVNYGSQTLYDHISLEYSLGVGIRRINSTSYAYGYDSNNKTIDGVGTTSANTLGYNIAFRVGYHF